MLTGMQGVVVRAHAKINLDLRVLGMATAKPNAEDRPGELVNNARRRARGTKVGDDQASAGF